MDPCSGAGDAVLQLADSLIGMLKNGSEFVWAIEMEKGRHDALASRFEYGRRQRQVLHGDAFQAYFVPGEGVSVLFLNPPYDTDPVYGRLEEKFLTRFASTLMPTGVLVFLVPFYALEASADTLGREFEDLKCFRFPEGDFDAFKQVVLFARKRSANLMQPDPAIVDLVTAWSKDAAAIPELREGVATITVPDAHRYPTPFSKFEIKELDLVGLLAKSKPWSVTDKRGVLQPISDILPAGAVENALFRTYPVAMPLRPAHIATGIAAGLFNGARIEPDDASSGLPPLLVKGVFDKEFRTESKKLDKDGNVRAEVQHQAPRLVTTVLDLTESRYVTIRPLATLTGLREITQMTMADLLFEYGRGLMEVMLRQCPVLHDPNREEDQIPLPELHRPLYHQQAQAAQTGIKLLGGLHATREERRGLCAFIAGEIGSGKTATSIAISQGIRAKRTLVLCPPHLLSSWEEQVNEVVPWVRVVVLRDIGDLEVLAADEDLRPIIAIMSREAAKLGYSVVGVTGPCPKCGTPTDPKVDYAKKRGRCEATPLRPRGRLGRAVYRLATALVNVFPKDPALAQVLESRPLQALFKRRPSVPGFDADAVSLAPAASAIDAVLDVLVGTEGELAWKTVMTILAAEPLRERVFRVARKIAPSDMERARDALLFVDSGPDLDAVVEELKAIPDTKAHWGNPWPNWLEVRKPLWGVGGTGWHPTFKRTTTGLVWDHLVVGSPSLILKALAKITPAAFVSRPECGEPLFQAVPEPRRYPLATYVARRLPDLFDLLILDEVHEYASLGSAQSKSAHRLTALGIPTLELTGTAMNGYAASLFVNTWALSKDFRNDFKRNEISRFVDRYGYRKQLVEDRDTDTGKVVTYGSMTDRVERVARVIGESPGVLPLYELKYLLPRAVTMHKADMRLNLPPCIEQVETITPDPELLKRYTQLQSALVTAIQKDRFDPELSGKLWGAMADLPSYFDLATADTGNRLGAYEIRYPESVGGALIASAEMFPSSHILPKEAWMLKRIEASLKEGRNALVFAWHTVLIPRLARLIEEQLGFKPAILDPSKVPTGKRQAWINDHVIAPGHRVLIANPVTISTGLNNLVYFSDQIWEENPMCNPTIYRQGVGRVDRIGQDKFTRIFFPVYEGTPQALHSLLMKKTAVAMSIDGLDAQGALRAAGVDNEDSISAFAVGRQLYEMIASGRIPSVKMHRAMNLG